MSSANVLVISNDYRLKTQILGTLKGDISLNVDITPINLSFAQSKLVRNVTNILIFDCDSIRAELSQFKLLMEKYNLFVILTGRMPPFNDPGIFFAQKNGVPPNIDYATLGVIIAQKVKNIAARASTITVQSIQLAVSAGQRIVTMGSSTGGTEALPVILSELPPEIPPLLIVQHMPSKFTTQFADRLNKICRITVKEAENGEFVKKGIAYIAPGDLHMRVAVRQQKLTLECFFSDRVHGVRPAADLLFESVAKISGGNAVGVILTGMGSDGARGLLEMHKKGAKVIGQDKESCIVYGMPKAAFEIGAVDYQLPLGRIASKIVELS